MQTNEKAKLLAYVLWNEFGSKLLNVSEATISTWLKEMRFRVQIHQLTQELNEVRQIASNLQAQGLIDVNPTYENFR